MPKTGAESQSRCRNLRCSYYWCRSGRISCRSLWWIGRLENATDRKRAPGGQAGTSSRIENYLGFPNGLSGSDLARRAITQATRFGVEFLSPQEVVGIESQDQYKVIHLSDGSSVNAKAVVITTGVNYRKLESKGLSDFTGAGVYYGAAMTEAHAFKGKQVYIVGHRKFCRTSCHVLIHFC